jgi:hypothetical protein
VGWCARARSGDQLAEAVGQCGGEARARTGTGGAIDRARAPVGTGDPRARLVCRDQAAARAVL